MRIFQITSIKTKSNNKRHLAKMYFLRTTEKHKWVRAVKIKAQGVATLLFWILPIPISSVGNFNLRINDKYLHFGFYNYDRVISSEHGGLSQWDRSYRPRIRPGTVISLNGPWELSLLALSPDYAKKIDPCRMLVWLGRRTVSLN